MPSVWQRDGPFVVGTGRAARLGILIRDAASLQRLAVVTDVATDKTGTVTTGKLAVVDVRAVEGVDEQELIRLTASVEALVRAPACKGYTHLFRFVGSTSVSCK